MQVYGILFQALKIIKKKLQKTEELNDKVYLKPVKNKLIRINL